MIKVITTLIWYFLKLPLCADFDYADTWFPNFAIEYLHEDEKVHETVFACSYGAQVKSVKQK